MSLSLNEADRATLRLTGQDITRQFVAIVVETFLYATYGCLVVIATRALLKSRRPATLALFALVVTMFMLDTVLWIFDIHDLILEVSAVLTSTSPDSLQDKYEHATFASLFPLAPVFYTLMTVMGDIIIIWRVFAFWLGPRERWLLAIPLFVFSSSIVTLFMIIDCSVKAKGQLVLGNFDNGPFCQHTQTASYLANTLTTLVATIMIGFKTWQYRREIGSVMRESSSRTRVERVMLMLVESGVLYFLFFLEVFISSLGNITAEQSASVGLAFATTVYIYASSHIVGIYPTIIVIVVHHHKSFIGDATTTLPSVATTLAFNPAALRKGPGDSHELNSMPSSDASKRGALGDASVAFAHDVEDKTFEDEFEGAPRLGPRGKRAQTETV